jgi:catechol 2,3-dioxygenase-like lactoylglutathione lyase family enzyme
MLDHVFLSVSDVPASISFYEKTLSPLGIRHSIDYDGADGPEGHPDLKGFGSNGRVYFWLRSGSIGPGSVHIGFVAKSQSEVDAAYSAAIDAGARDNGRPGARTYYDPRYYAANFLDPDGYSIEVVFKSWQHSPA